MKLKPVDRVEVTVLMDNMADYLLPASERVVRPPLIKEGWMQRIPLFAEHGLSLMIRLYENGNERNVLLDTAWSEAGLSQNMKYLGVNPESIENIVLSHGHIDHCGGLLWLLEEISHPVPIVAHPDVFVPVRYLEWEDRVNMIQPDKQAILDKGGELIETKEAYFSTDGLWAATGQIPRLTEFERGVPDAYLERNGQKEKDDLLDDQSIVISLKERGLVVISGCAHAGIINTIKYCQEITGIEQVCAVMGGFHLSGPINEPIHDQTINALKDIGPDILVPMHCTGFKAIARMMREFPEQHILSGVGAKFILDASE